LKIKPSAYLRTEQVINKFRWLLFASLLFSCRGYLPYQIQTEIATISATPVWMTTFTNIPFTATTTTTFTAIPSSTSRPEPPGCLRPSDDYMRRSVGSATINERTMEMLVHAKELYGGELDITGWAITQGSYTNEVSASFGTHTGGGAVDLAVMRKNTYTVIWIDIDPLLHALRVAGFAAWLRDYGELYKDSPIHIHAIAIGDKELSQPAQEQLTGGAGYFRGFSGLPTANGIPTPDRFGGPILCNWMIDLGHSDLR